MPRTPRTDVKRKPPTENRRKKPEKPELKSRTTPAKKNPDVVEEAGMDSFPASDPPSFTPIVGY